MAICNPLSYFDNCTLLLCTVQVYTNLYIIKKPLFSSRIKKDVGRDHGLRTNNCMTNRFVTTTATGCDVGCRFQLQKHNRFRGGFFVCFFFPVRKFGRVYEKNVLTVWLSCVKTPNLLPSSNRPLYYKKIKLKVTFRFDKSDRKVTRDNRITYNTIWILIRTNIEVLSASPEIYVWKKN